MSHKGRKLSEEHKKNLSISLKGKKKKYKKRKITLKTYESRRGRKLSDEHKQKISDELKKNHPFKGKHHTEETKLKISKTLKGFKHTKETKKKISQARLKEKHSFYGKTLSIEHRQKLSESQAKAWLRKENKQITYHKGYYHSKKVCKKFHYNSSWEKIVMEYLDKHPLVIWWDYEPCIISYNDEYGIRRNYIPDFIIEFDCLKEMWEVKPSFKIKDHDEGYCRFHCKLNALMNYADENNIDQIRIITEEEIKIIKNIDFELLNKKYGVII